MESTRASYTLSERFYLTALAGELLPNARVGWCMKHRKNASADISINRNNSKAWYGNIRRCGSGWVCAYCAHQISMRRVEQITTAMLMAEPFYTPYLITYTLSHHADHSLKHSLDTLLEAQRYMRKQRVWRETQKALQKYTPVNPGAPSDKLEYFAGLPVGPSIKALEVTHTNQNGWHPHIHEIVFLPKDYVTDVGRYALQDELKLMLTDIHWLYALDHAGGSASEERGVDVKVGNNAVGEYLAKWGRPPMPHNVTSGVSFELARGQFKPETRESNTPFTLLERYGETDNQRYARLFREFAAATSNKSQFRWSRGASSILEFSDETDEQLADEDRELHMVLGYITIDEWRAINKHHAKARVLELAMRDVEEMFAYIGQLVQ